jgi:hypothetical protein
VLIRFTKAARKHRIGRPHARYVMASVVPTEIVTAQGEQGWLWVASDERGRELSIIGVEIIDSATRQPTLLVIHVQPRYR